MVIVAFEHNKEKDLFNIWSACNQTNRWRNHQKDIRSKVLEIAKNKSFDECKSQLEEYYNQLYQSPAINNFLETLNKTWGEIEERFVKKVENIHKKPFFPQKLTGYLTMTNRCPYSLEEKWFFVSFFSPLMPALLSSAHEILHFQFHKYYWNRVAKQIGEEKTSDLKEALTVLLNLEFRDIFFVKENGYEPHKELREFISNEWKKEKDFELLIKKCIIYLKKNKI